MQQEPSGASVTARQPIIIIIIIIVRRCCDVSCVGVSQVIATTASFPFLRFSQSQRQIRRIKKDHLYRPIAYISLRISLYIYIVVFQRKWQGPSHSRDQMKSSRRIIIMAIRFISLYRPFICRLYKC